ncbi:MAG: class I adenylate-forming enzyme family protein [Vicinamibacteraceae bacterium]
MPVLVDAVRRRARDNPDAPLIDAPAERRVVTARRLGDDVVTTAAELRRLGIGPGHAVAVHVGNRTGYFSLLLACLDVGAALLPIDGSAPVAEATAVATRFDASAMVVPQGRDGAGEHALPGGLRLARRADPAATIVAPPAGPVAMLKLTSGSTGVPKATVTTEDQIAADGRALIEAMGIRPDDWQVCAIPVSHSYALGNVVGPLLLQGTPIVLRDTFVPTQILDDAVRAGARLFPGVPFMFDRLVALVRDGCPWPVTLETMISAGAPLDRATARAFAEHTGRRIHSLYGTSETAGIAYDVSPDPDGEVTMGRPVPGVTLAFWPDDAAQPGTGRIHVTGPAVSSGYAAGADDAAFVDGGFLTGDLGALGVDGRLRLKGRVSAFVNVAGRKVQPDEVEGMLRTHPLVADARVFGLPDERRGEQLAACVVPRNGTLGVVALRAFCAERLAAYKIPRLLVLVAELPRDERGKVSRKALEKLVLGPANQGLP